MARLSVELQRFFSMMGAILSTSILIALFLGGASLLDWLKA